MLRLSGDLIHLGPQESEVFNVFGFLNPFQSTNVRNHDDQPHDIFETYREDKEVSKIRNQQSTLKLYRHPICCFNCSGYLNEFARLDDSNNKWVCPICEYKNPAFYRGSMLSAMYPELQSSDTLFLESARGESEFGPCQRRLLVLAFDYCINNEQELTKLLSTSLSNVPKDTKVAIISFSNSIQLLRLFAIQSDLCICVDTLSGSQNQAHTIEHLINKDNQLYSISATTALEFLDVIVSTLVNLAYSPHNPSGLQIKTGRPRRPKPVCAVNPILDLASTLGSTGHLGSHLLIYCTRSLSVFKPEYILKNPMHIGHSNVTLLYSAVAKQAYENAVWVDIFFVGLDIPHLDHLEAVSSASGGYVITGQSFLDASLLDSMGALLRKSSAPQNVQDAPASYGASSMKTPTRAQTSRRELLPYYPLPGSVISVQVLTSPDLEVSMLLGSMSVPVNATPFASGGGDNKGTFSPSTLSPSNSSKSLRIPTPTKSATALNDSKYLFARKSSLTVPAPVSRRHLGDTIECVFAAETGGRVSPGGSTISTSTHGSDITPVSFGLESGGVLRGPPTSRSVTSSPRPTSPSHSARSYSERKTETRTKQEKLERIVSKITKYAQRSLVACGFCRADPAAELTLQFKYHPHLSVTTPSSPRSAPLSAKKLFTALNWTSSDDSASKSKGVQYCYVQCIVRQLYLSDSTDEITATRVITCRIPKSDYTSIGGNSTNNSNSDQTSTHMDASSATSANESDSNFFQDAVDNLDQSSSLKKSRRGNPSPLISQFNTVPPPPLPPPPVPPPPLTVDTSVSSSIPPPPPTPPPPLAPPVNSHAQSQNNDSSLPLSPETGMMHFMRGLHWQRHMVGLCKYVVSEYHDSVVMLYGGAKQKALGSLSSKGFSARVRANFLQDIRESWLTRIDTIVGHISQTFLACAASTCSLSYHGDDDDDARTALLLLNKYGDSIMHKNVLNMLRCLYHLREGSLLDGPATQSQLSFLSRSWFLAMPVDAALPMVLPAMTTYQFASTVAVDGIASPSSTEQTFANDYDFLPGERQTDIFKRPAYNTGLQVSIPPPPPPSSFLPVTRELVPPESLAALPSLGLLLDLGDTIIIRPPTILATTSTRRGSHSGSPRSPQHGSDEYLSPELSGSTARSGDSTDTETMRLLMQAKIDNKRERRRLRKLMQHAVNDAIDLCRRRFPVPTICSLSVSHEPAYRLLYARLSPSHMDVEELQRLAVPQLSTLTPEELDLLVSTAPVTDQPSFERYLWTAAPKYAKARKCYLECLYLNKPLSSETMMRDDLNDSQFTDGNADASSKTFLEKFTSILFGSTKNTHSGRRSVSEKDKV